MFTPEEQKSVRFKSALDLLRFMMLEEVAKKYKDIDIDDLNKVLVVAGLPVVVPEEIKAKELDVIKIEEEG